MNQAYHEYDQLNHDLDEEEIEFKRMIESSHGGMDDDDDIENLFGDGEVEELSFSARDKDRLNMLEKLRSNLVAESVNTSDSISEDVKNSGSPGSPEENSDDEMRL